MTPTQDPGALSDKQHALAHAVKVIAERAIGFRGEPLHVRRKALYAAIDALAARTSPVGQRAVAKIVNGNLAWNLAQPTDAVPLHLLRGEHLLYTKAVGQAKPVCWEAQNKETGEWSKVGLRGYDTMEASLAGLKDVGFAVRALYTEAAPAEPQWQDISTAPKDGTSVLLARFAPGKDRPIFYAVDYWHEREKHGYTGWGRFNPSHWPATHWQPLDAPPGSPPNLPEGSDHGR